MVNWIIPYLEKKSNARQIRNSLAVLTSLARCRVVLNVVFQVFGLFLMFRKVFSSKLDRSTTWYALSIDVCLVAPRKFGLTNFFQVFTNEIKKVQLIELQTENGDKVPESWFFPSGNKTRVSDVYVGTAFAIIGGLCNRRSDLLQLKTVLCPEVLEAIKAIQLEEFNVKTAQEASTIDGRIGCLNGQAFQGDTLGKSNLKLWPKTKSPPKIQCAPKLVQSPIESNTSSSSDNQSIDEICCSKLTSPVKRRKIREKAREIFGKINNVCEYHHESLASVLTVCCTSNPQSRASEVREIISKVIDGVSQNRGIKRTFAELISEDAWEKRMAEIRVPDWQCLLLKLQGKIPDESWQSLINVTKLGKKEVCFCNN